MAPCPGGSSQPSANVNHLLEAPSQKARTTENVTLVWVSPLTFNEQNEDCFLKGFVRILLKRDFESDLFTADS